MLGAFILIDRLRNTTAAGGIVCKVDENGNNVKWQQLDINRSVRENKLQQKAVTIWLTGLSGAGKSTIANEIEKRLCTLGKHTMLLDGDNVRMGLNSDLNFGEKDRMENIRRVAEVARLMNDAGLIVITSLISPYHSDRKMAKDIIGKRFVEIYVSTPLEVCEKRDIKGLYKKAKEGKISDFTGISSPYEIPCSPDIEVDTSNCELEKCVDQIMDQLSVMLEEEE